jgi:hypothetical protein
MFEDSIQGFLREGMVLPTGHLKAKLDQVLCVLAGQGGESSKHGDPVLESRSLIELESQLILPKKDDLKELLSATLEVEKLTYKLQMHWLQVLSFIDDQDVGPASIVLNLEESLEGVQVVSQGAPRLHRAELAQDLLEKLKGRRVDRVDDESEIVSGFLPGVLGEGVDLHQPPGKAGLARADVPMYGRGAHLVLDDRLTLGQGLLVLSRQEHEARVRIYTERSLLETEIGFIHRRNSRNIPRFKALINVLAY